jgi:hypothetical protein
MDALVLLQRAREAGLRVESFGDTLTVRGPKEAEPVVKLLAAHKAEVLATLAPTTSGAVVARHWEPCFHCGQAEGCVQQVSIDGEDFWLHPACERPFLARLDAASPPPDYWSAPPPYARAIATLRERCPGYVEEERWRQAVEDGRRFLAHWGEQAAALGWTEGDLFGLHEPPAEPHPSYQRLSRRDCIGLVWLLQGAPVVALTADAAAIETADRTSGLMYYRPPATSAAPASMSSDGSRSTTSSSSSSSSTGARGNEGNALSCDSRVGQTH